jgi:hypothetical protein
MIDSLLPSRRAAKSDELFTANRRAGPRFNLNERSCCRCPADAAAVDHRHNFLLRMAAPRVADLDAIG